MNHSISTFIRILSFSLIAIFCVLFFQSCKKENKGPECVVTTPNSNSNFSIGEKIPIEVEASDSDGTIELVQVTIGDEDPVELSQPPYKLEWDSDGASPMAMTIKAVAFDDKGSSASHEVGIVLGDIPQAAFSSTPPHGAGPLEVAFTDESTNNPTGWLWDFGDGTISTQPNPTHVYYAVGKYTVTLKVRNEYGEHTIEKEEEVEVLEKLSAKFILSGNYTHYVGYAPSSEVGFVDLSTGNPTSWLWDFGDGTTSTSKWVKHTYTEPGRYTVSLTVTNSYFTAVETKSDVILIHSPCPDTPSVMDADYNGYPTVLIGDKCWMRKNLRVTRYVDWEEISFMPEREDWIENSYQSTYCYFNNDESYLRHSGCLYNRKAALRGESGSGIPGNVQGICPNGWHIPTREEWSELIEFYGGENVAAEALKECISGVWFLGWDDEYPGNNESGLAVDPGGKRSGTAGNDFIRGAYLFTADSNYCISLSHYNQEVNFKLVQPDHGMSVRCLKDY